MTQGLERILRATLGGYYYNCKRNKVCALDDSDNYIAYIKIDTSDLHNIECPISLVSNIVGLLSQYPNGEFKEFIVPLQRTEYNMYNDICKSIDSAFKHLYESRNGFTLNKAVLNNLILYGTLGLILDENYNPMMMVTVNFDYANLTFHDYTVTIPPDVYFGKDKASQGIIKKLVPYYLEKDFRTDFLTELHTADFQPIVTFKPITNYVTMYNQALDMELNPQEILHNNITTLKDSLKHVL